MRIGGIVLPILAVAVGAAALAVALSRKPDVPGNSLSEYDFETPEGAVRSKMEIEATGDTRARMELQRAEAILSGEKLRKRLQTWEDCGTVEYEGKTAVLSKYKDADRDRVRKVITWVEKKEDGLYYQTSPPQLRDPDVLKKLREWQSSTR